MEKIADDSKSKIINDASLETKSNKDSQNKTLSEGLINIFNILNRDKIKEKKIEKDKPQLKLNILQNDKENFFIDNDDIIVPCHYKVDKKYQQGFFYLINNKIIILKEKIEKKRYNAIKNIIKMSRYNFYEESFDNIEIKPTEIYKNNLLLYLDFSLLTCKLLRHKTKYKFKILILGKQEGGQKIYSFREIKFKMIEVEKGVFNMICQNLTTILSNANINDNVINASLNKFFCTNFYINYFNFSKIAKTGDFILFRNKSYSSQFQRFLTQGQYDHIALLIKLYNELYVYETTGKDGVVLRRWSEFIYYYWFVFSEKIVFRKLLCSLEAKKKYIKDYVNETKLEKNNNSNVVNSSISDNDFDNMDKSQIDEQFYNILATKMTMFMKEIKSSKYYFSFFDYLCIRFSKAKNHNNIKKTGYFCSELIAAVFNYCGILSDEMNITRYLPSSFAEYGDAMFNEGFNLGPEYVIIFP